MKLHLVQADRFDDIDDNGDGLIDADELEDEYSLPEIVAKSYIQAYDKNGDGGLDRQGRNVNQLQVEQFIMYGEEPFNPFEPSANTFFLFLSFLSLSEPSGIFYNSV